MIMHTDSDLLDAWKGDNNTELRTRNPMQMFLYMSIFSEFVYIAFTADFITSAEPVCCVCKLNMGTTTKRHYLVTFER